MSISRLTNPTMILLSAVATALLAAFAPGPFSLGGTALAQELSANFRVTSYGQTWVSLACEVPQGRGITNYTLQRYESDGSTTPWDRYEDETFEGPHHGWTMLRLEPDTQYSYVLRLKDDSGTTIIETSVTVRTLPTPDPSDPTAETPTPDPSDPTDETPTPDPNDPTDETPTPDPQQPLVATSGEDQQGKEQPTPTVELDGISSNHDSVRENNGQATNITLTVTLDKVAAAGGETITLAIVSPTQGKTAKRGEDFDATLDETITIAKGRIKGTAQLTLTPKDNETADGDKAFGVQAESSSGHRALIDIKIYDDDIDGEEDGEVDDGKEEDDEEDGEKPFVFAGEVEDQAYTAGTTITALILPEATGGEGEVTYRVLGLPAGLSFDATTRTISGTPTAATDGPVEVTYLAQDSAETAAILTFFITVNPPLSFGDLFGLLNGGASDAEATNS